MDIQRLRNLTTRILHTKLEHIYEDMEEITGEKGIMTHMLPRVCDAITPWLKDKVKDQRFWDGKFDPSHTGNYELPKTTEEERNLVFKRFSEMPSPF